MQTVEVDVKYQIDKAKSVLGHFAQLYEANWLWAFSPDMRTQVDQEELEILTIDFTDWDGENSFHHLSPKVIALYEQVYSRQGEGMGFDYFTKGAVAMANLFPDPDLLMGFFASQLEWMFETNEYPKLSPRYLEDYVDVITAVMLGEEQTTWKQMLAYTSGVYWVLSLCRIDSMYPGFQDTIRLYMIERAKKGTVDGI